MERRFAHHNLFATFVNAVSPSDPIVPFYAGKFFTSASHMVHIPCFISHLHALTAFTMSGADRGVICEDDVLFHNDFMSKFSDVIDNAGSTPLITLCAMITEWVDYRYTGVDPSKLNLVTIDRNHTWGAHCYVVTRDYALHALSLYNRPFDRHGTEITAEIIVRASGGVLAHPYLVIEDMIDSDRAPHELSYHRKHFECWGIENYSSSEITATLFRRT